MDKNNRSYRFKIALCSALLITASILIPYLIKITKYDDQNSIVTNKSVQSTPEAIMQEGTEQIIKDDGINNRANAKSESHEKDSSYIKALETVRNLAKERYKEFSVCSTDEIIRNEKDNQDYYVIIISEIITGTGIPSSRDIFGVNVNTLEVKAAKLNDYISVSEYFSQKEKVDERMIYEPQILLLINKADNLNIKDNSDIYQKIKTYRNLKYELKTIDPKIPEDAYCYKEQLNTYY